MTSSRRGETPEYIRCDNGPELTANALRDWCRFSGAGTSYIEPGSPWENPFVESFGSRLRDELLSIEQFDTLLEAQVLIGDWKREYNNYRPHSSLGWRAPVAYATAWKAKNQVDRLSKNGGPMNGVRSRRVELARERLNQAQPGRSRPPNQTAFV